MNTYTVAIANGLRGASFTGAKATMLAERILQLMCMDSNSTAQMGVISDGSGAIRARVLMFNTYQRLPATLEPGFKGETLTGVYEVFRASTDDRYAQETQPVMQPIARAGDLAVVVSTIAPTSTLQNVLTFVQPEVPGDYGLWSGVVRESAQDGIYNNPFAGTYAYAVARNPWGKLYTRATATVQPVIDAMPSRVSSAAPVEATPYKLLG